MVKIKRTNNKQKSTSTENLRFGNTIPNNSGIKLITQLNIYYFPQNATEGTRLVSIMGHSI